MTTHSSIFYIRDSRGLGVETKCPVCGDQCYPNDYVVFDGNHLPLCNLCAWDKAPGLASLIALGVASHYHSRGSTPDDVFESLEKRKSDPKRLQN